MHSNYDIKFVLRLPIPVITRLLVKAYEKRERSKTWDMWLTKYPSMTKKDFVEYNDFHKMMTKPQVKVEHPEETVQDTYNRFKNSVKKVKDNERNHI